MGESASRQETEPSYEAMGTLRTFYLLKHLNQVSGLWPVARRSDTPGREQDFNRYYVCYGSHQSLPPKALYQR